MRSGSSNFSPSSRRNAPWQSISMPSSAWQKETEMRRPALTGCLVAIVVACWVFIVRPPATAQSRWYEVYFSQVNADQAQARSNPQSIDRILAHKLVLAQTSIDAAVHEIDSEILTQALVDAHQR